MSEDTNDHDQKGKKSHKATSGRGSKPKKTLSKSEKVRRTKNREKGYPAEVALKSPGPKRKFYLNDRHVHKQAVLDAALAAGDKSSITKAELSIARSVIPRERFLEEPELMGLAFVLYRYQSPWRRTENFAKMFDKIFREYLESDFAETIPAPSREALSLWPDSDIVALWRARQHADSLGVPYSFYIRTAFKYRFNTGYKRCPKPGQLWHGGKILEHIKKEFKAYGGNAALREYSAATIDPMFLVENYQGDAIQRAAHADLRLKTRIFPDFFKLDAMLRSRIITKEAARHHFGDALVDRVEMGYESSRIRQLPVSLTEAQRPKPGCFGMHEPTATDCPTCPIRVECQVLQAQVDAIILTEYGSTDPVKATTTNAAKLRKQRQRERERLNREAAASKGADRGVEVESEVSSNEDRRPKP